MNSANRTLKAALLLPLLKMEGPAPTLTYVHILAATVWLNTLVASLTFILQKLLGCTVYAFQSVVDKPWILRSYIKMIDQAVEIGSHV